MRLASLALAALCIVSSLGCADANDIPAEPIAEDSAALVVPNGLIGSTGRYFEDHPARPAPGWINGWDGSLLHVCWSSYDAADEDPVTHYRHDVCESAPFCDGFACVLTGPAPGCLGQLRDAAGNLAPADCIATTL